MKACYRDIICNIAIALIVSVFGVLVAFHYVSGRILVKGNGGSMIYHTNECASYGSTVIGNDEGDRYFLTEASAQEAGYRKAKNCYH